MAGRRARKPQDRGAALVMVLWGAVVMAIIAAAITRQASTSAVMVNASSELTRARALADGGVRLGWSAFADGRIADFRDVWACRSGEDALVVQLRPETARVDVNVASEELLSALFAAAGADRRSADALAAAAVAYRSAGIDAEGANEVEADGNEAPARQLEPDQFVRGPFQTIEELGYLPGMDVGLFRAVADDVSVHSRSSDIERRFASAIVRQAADEVARVEGRSTGEDDADPQLPAFEGSLLNVRATAVTGSGAVFVRDAVIEGPLDPDGQPTVLRLVQGRLREGERLPEVRSAPPCEQGFAAIRLPS